MQRALVMTVIGQDRPGLVDTIAGLVAGHDGNWLESRMSRLGGQFAGILRVEVPQEKMPPLSAALRRLETQGLTVVVHPDQPAPASSSPRLSLLEIVGQDRPGIVRQISHALAGYGVNVEELHTECASAAMSGETLFTARAKLSLPAECNVAELRRRLEKIAGDLIVDLTFQELAEAAAP
ncbi:MAG TPA: ACT domain-containing protein [Dongiaceae bacterium]|nr:ACT domain-containing protein [Dongiaceae bacterium]